MNRGVQTKKKLVLAFLILAPLIAGLVWCYNERKKEKEQAAGLNTLLPEAKFKKSDSTKSFFYDQDKDEKTVNDSFPKHEGNLSMLNEATSGFSRIMYDPSPYATRGNKDSNEMKVYERLRQIEERVKEPHLQRVRGSISHKKEKLGSIESPQEINRLGSILETREGKRESDPELDALNGMMEKILDIQHPERVKEKMKQEEINNGSKVYSVQTQSNAPTISLLASDASSMRDHHYWSENNSTKGTYTILASVWSNQSLSSGELVKLRLLQDLKVKAVHIPRGSPLFGQAMLEGDRLKITISNIVYGTELFPVQLSVFDQDGLEGISVPNRKDQENRRQSSNDIIQRLNIPQLEPSFKSQAASAGIQTARSLLTRRVRQLTFTVPAGYKVLLKSKDN